MAPPASSPMNQLLAVVAVLAACARPGQPVLPTPDVRDDLWLVHEVLPLDGPERTGAWRESFDAAGCHRQASNSWLWVFDPVLRRSPDPTLYWNADWPERPDFCVTPNQLQAIRRGLDASWPLAAAPPRVGWVERWTARRADQTAVWVFPLGRPPAEVLPLLAALTATARQGVWGQSPEQDATAER